MKKLNNTLGRSLAGLVLVLCLCFGFMPMQTKAAATEHTLILNGEWDQTGALSNENSKRNYKFTLPSAGYFNASFCTFASGQKWELLDENWKNQFSWGGTIWNASESAPENREEGRWLEAGTYYICVSKYDKNANGKFWIKGSFRPAGNQEKEPNQTYAQAHPISLGQSIRGLLTWQDDHDYYSFSLTQAQTITLHLTTYCDGVRIRLMNSDLKELSGDTKWGGSESEPGIYTKDVSLNPGIYYVHIDRYGSSTNDSSRGLYDLKVMAATVKASSVKLNRSELSIYEGDMTTLSAAIAPENATNKNVLWSSSRSSVASVDANGSVTGLKAGTAVITASAADGSGASASCEVTVKAKPVQKTLSVNTSKVKLYKGQKVRLQAVTTPAAQMTFSSSNRKVARVSSKGKITAVSKGKCTIYVRANGLERRVAVTVKNPEIKLKKTSVKLTKGKKYSIECTVKPDANITFRSSNKKIATVNAAGKIKAKRKGTCVVYVTANKITKSVKVTVK